MLRKSNEPMSPRPYVQDTNDTTLLILYTKPPTHRPNSKISLFNPFQKPLHHLLKHTLPPRLNHIPMTRNHAIKIPLGNPLHTLRKPHPIRRTSHIPNEPLLPRGVSARILKRGEEPGINPRRRRHAGGARVLFGGGQVEEQIGLDERFVGLVAEDQFLIRMAADEIQIELLVEIRINKKKSFVLLREDPLELRSRRVGVFLPLLRQTLHGDQFCRRVGPGPFRQEDVMLIVRRRQVRDVVPQRFDRRTHFGRQRRRGEDGDRTGSEAHCSEPGRRHGSGIQGAWLQ